MSRPLLIVLIAWGVGLSGWIFLSQGGTTGQQPAQLYDGWSNQLVSPAGMLPPDSIPSITTVQSSGVRTNSPSPSSQPSFMVTTTPTPNHTNPPIVTPLPTTPRTPTPNPTIIITPTPTPVFSIAPTQIPQITQTPIPTPTPEQNQSTEIIILSPLPIIYRQRADAELKIHILPQAQCSIKLTLPSGGISSAKGLEPKTADNTGAITWTWGVSWNTKTGTGKIELVCTRNDQSFSKSISMSITSP